MNSQQQLQQQSLRSSEIITANIFGVSTTSRMESIVGDVVGEYSCVWEKYNGSLFAGSKGVYFLGSSFLFQRKLVLVWEEIRLVQKVDQGVEVVCKKDGVVHSFAGILAPERVWALLLTLHNDALLDRRGKRKTPRSGLRRRNSDPWNTSSMVADELRVLDHLPPGGGGSSNINDSEATSPPIATSTSVTIPQEKSASPLQNGSAVLTPRMQNTSHDMPRKSLTVATASTPQRTNIGSSLRLTSSSEIESIAGPLRLPPIPCTYDNTRGRLHVGEESIFFLGRKFFWEKKTAIVRWEVLSRIQVVAEESRVERPRTDGLRFVQSNDESFDFKGIADAHSIWASLLSLHNEKLTLVFASGNRHRLHRRNNSDPNLQAYRLKFEDLAATNDSSAVLDTSVDSMGYNEQSSSGLDDNNNTSKLPVEEDWSMVQQIGKCDVLVIDARILKCSLDHFFDLFVSDQAEHSLPKFLALKGDRDLQESPWKTSDEHDHATHTRVVRFTHPVNAPLAPPEAAARKEQSYQRYGAHGVVVETKTFVDDVPMADCFYVYDRIVVQPKEGGDSEENEVSISMEFSVKFVKSTMFRSIISKTTNTEFTEFSVAYANHMATCLGEAPPVVETEQVAVNVEEKKEVPLRRPSFEKTVISLLVVIILFQLRIMLEIRGIKASCHVQTQPQEAVPFSSLSTDGASLPKSASLSKKDVEASPTTLVTKDYVLKCNIEDFFDLFLSDNAKHSLASFLESRDNRDLSVTTWKAVDGDDEDDSIFRALDYIHPLKNIPLAPSEASTRKEQTFWSRSSTELVVETLTFVEDVPLADCFFVSDWMTVRAIGKDQVAISMEFSRTFTKSTMLKGIISKTSGSEFTAFSMAYMNFLSQSLGDTTPELAVSDEEKKVQHQADTSVPAKSRRRRFALPFFSRDD